MAHGLERFDGFFLIFPFGIKVFFIEITPILKLKSEKIRLIHQIRVPFIKAAKIQIKIRKNPSNPSNPCAIYQSRKCSFF